MQTGGPIKKSLDRKRREESFQKQRLFSETEEKYKESLKVREDLMQRVNGFDKEVLRLTSAREKLEEKQQELLEYMWENYELTYHQAKSLSGEEPQESLTELKKKIAEIKTQIRELGPVNVNAIEDYKDVLERYEFLKNSTKIS